MLLKSWGFLKFFSPLFIYISSFSNFQLDFIISISKFQNSKKIFHNCKLKDKKLNFSKNRCTFLLKLLNFQSDQKQDSFFHFFSVYCDVSPSGVAQFYFPISMLKKDFYNFYLEDINDQDKCYGIRQFMTCIKKSKVKFPKTSALGKCSTCIEIQTQLKKKNLRTADRDKIITQKDEHLNKIYEKKALYYSHIRKSKSNNRQFSSIIMDMTQDIKLPHFIPIPKDLTMGANYHYDAFLGAVLNNGFII